MKKNDDLTRSLRIVCSKIMNLQTYDWSKRLNSMGKEGEPKP